MAELGQEHQVRPERLLWRLNSVLTPRVLPARRIALLHRVRRGPVRSAYPLI